MAEPEQPNINRKPNVNIQIGKSMPQEIDLVSLFHSVTHAMQQNYSALNQADEVNQDL